MQLVILWPIRLLKRPYWINLLNSDTIEIHLNKTVNAKAQLLKANEMTVSMLYGCAKSIDCPCLWSNLMYLKSHKSVDKDFLMQNGLWSQNHKIRMYTQWTVHKKQAPSIDNHLLFLHHIFAIKWFPSLMQICKSHSFLPPVRKFCQVLTFNKLCCRMGIYLYHACVLVDLEHFQQRTRRLSFQ